ncbi:hypothetical protein Q4E93_20540 [Flavitalea sp. BT771]|uniref:hypothetical protein n=1 Tax=Flavitalea sp. BT771 TaxID=3063329 RepID=UPI0026E2FDD6|nr:hypothetical protein [Flavitalea sp. BT771]MDO6433008.1 hypothetical protein [Flavitalea sp. BT771]MDV6221716.1 hypothetical protein [Flavitalea sp. BT771]
MKSFVLLIGLCSYRLLLCGQPVQPSPRLVLPKLMHCLDDVTATVDPAQPGILVRSDVDDSSFVTDGGLHFYLGHLKGPGLYTIREDSVDFHYFVFSCRDHTASDSYFPLTRLPRIQKDTIDLAGVLDSMRVEALKGKSDFLSDVDNVNSTLSSFVDSGQVMKLAVFFDKAAGYIGVTVDNSASVVVPDRDKIVAITDSFFIRLFRQRHPERADLNNQELAVLDLAMNIVLPPGRGLERSPNFRYSKYLVDDLLSSSRRLPLDPNSALASVGFDKKYFEQMVLLIRIYQIPKVQQ